jgi:hypothetical protein
MTKSYLDVKKDLIHDGALRDFYILDVSQSEWDKFIAVAPIAADYFYFIWKEKEVSLPAKFSDIVIMQQESLPTLSMSVSGSILNCHFFVSSEIELDFDPDDIQSEKQWNDLLVFFQKIIDCIGKKGIITYENMQEWLIDEILPMTH